MAGGEFRVAFTQKMQTFLIRLNSFLHRAVIAALPEEGDEAVERIRSWQLPLLHIRRVPPVADPETLPVRHEGIPLLLGVLEGSRDGALEPSLPVTQSGAALLGQDRGEMLDEGHIRRITCTLPDP